MLQLLVSKVLPNFDHVCAVDVRNTTKEYSLSACVLIKSHLFSGGTALADTSGNVYIIHTNEFSVGLTFYTTTSQEKYFFQTFEASTITNF